MKSGAILDADKVFRDVPSIVQEYETLLDALGPNPRDQEVREYLIRFSEWSERGAATILCLAKQYGTFALSNALALAEALKIEDGDAGL